MMIFLQQEALMGSREMRKIHIEQGLSILPLQTLALMDLMKDMPKSPFTGMIQ